MAHLIAAASLALACALWVAVQRASGGDDPAGDGGCAHCRGRDRCDREDAG